MSTYLLGLCGRTSVSSPQTSAPTCPKVDQNSKLLMSSFIHLHIFRTLGSLLSHVMESFNRYSPSGRQSFEELTK